MICIHEVIYSVCSRNFCGILSPKAVLLTAAHGIFLPQINRALPLLATPTMTIFKTMAVLH